MRVLALVLAVLLVAGCSPSAGIPSAVAKPTQTALPLHPDVAEGAADGAVFEYH